MTPYFACLLGLLLGACLAAALRPSVPRERPRWANLHMPRDRSTLDQLRRITLGPPPRRVR